MSETEITRAFGSKCSFSFRLFFLSGFFAPKGAYIHVPVPVCRVSREALRFRRMCVMMDVRQYACEGTVIN